MLAEPFSGLDPVGVDALAGVLQAQVDEGTAVVFSSHQLDLVEWLSDEITIVDRGRAVAAGAVSALRRSRGADQLKIALEGGWTAWADNLLPGARVVGHDGDEVVLELLAGADDQDVLHAARRAGKSAPYGVRRRRSPNSSEWWCRHDEV